MPFFDLSPSESSVERSSMAGHAVDIPARSRPGLLQEILSTPFRALGSGLMRVFAGIGDAGGAVVGGVTRPAIPILLVIGMVFLAGIFFLGRLQKV